MVASTTNKIEVQFHSDQSHTDTGFSAEYLSYDSSDRELKPLRPWGQLVCPDLSGGSPSSALTLPRKLGSVLFWGI